MAFKTNFLLPLVLMFAVPLMVNAFVWNVGDAAGWSGQAQYDYHYWALGPAFLVGDDSLRFVYDRNTTNVLEVTSADYISCNATSPLAAYNTGNDTIPITKKGYQYFISGNSVDCNNGLKVDIWASNSSYVRFWRSGPAFGPDGYINVPDFD
ncbi:mavicyanin-like [Papaver somniferum]|uniref:mavicyanin-like n=1 Tax=Papaver somniferum TaxID=3469 RepID=UPI000E6F921E|nr:mavicyanin-like [Papaver somniferum]